MKALLKTAESKSPYDIDAPKKPSTSTKIKTPKPTNNVKFKPVKSNSKGSKKKGDSLSKILKNIEKDSEKQEERALMSPDVKPQ